jgi:mono/diheme cytochrome c family protein
MIRFTRFFLFVIGALLIISSCFTEHEKSIKNAIGPGYSLYEKNCLKCHGKYGQGVEGIYPPLNNKEYFESKLNQVPKIIKYGLKGMVEVNGKSYFAPMPAHQKLTNLEISHIINFIQLTFNGNQNFVNQNYVDSCLTVK